MTAGTINTLPFCGACGHDLRIDNGVDVFCDACGQDANYTVTGDVAPPATNASSGTPGSWLPLGSAPPADAAAVTFDATTLFGFPQNEWVDGAYVVCENNDELWWDGTVWQPGRAALYQVDIPVITAFYQTDDADPEIFTVEWTANDEPARFDFSPTLYINIVGTVYQQSVDIDTSLRTVQINLGDHPSAPFPTGSTIRAVVKARGDGVPNVDSEYMWTASFDSALTLATSVSPPNGSAPNNNWDAVWQPSPANPAADAAAIAAIPSDPVAAWAADQFAACRDNSLHRWDGAAWVVVVAP